MSSGNSSRRHRGPKPSRFRRAEIPSSKGTRTSSGSSISSVSSSSRVQYSNTNRSSSAECSVTSEPIGVRSTKSVGSAISLANSVFNVVAPDLDINPGDRKEIYNLEDKGKLVIINRVNGEVVYMLRCVDGRRVYIEKAAEGASLILTNQKGKVIKSLAGHYVT
ncbi:Protein CBG12852 [Caenorhabditis briggsae]|uniref:Protein CBG12852 n=2 Tax=Caenorhabditis briggsae TaxID=6238 RepID=A8XFR3_CAEBR|nr:Protein CBG12852 [Caenorhabditis briggsae]ULU13139.1 hypothetical protein L3Y34_015968 [Caenorhabditis briggsae]CAP31759.1 Protein CBG12852 [Caenorhabditis briggsae]